MAENHSDPNGDDGSPTCDLHEDLADSLNDDGRGCGEWESRWPDAARKKILKEAIFVGIVFLSELVGLVFTWRGDVLELLSLGCANCTPGKLNFFLYLFLGGMLGGTLFGIKYLYKVVARGFWNEDRLLWRIYSPFISGGLALAIGALIDSGILGLSAAKESATSYFSIGFIAGYFADSALAKMQEIAKTVFGHPNPDDGTRES